MKAKSKVILDYNKTCDNMCQWNMGTKRIYEMKIINNWKEDIKKNLQTYKGQRWHRGIKTNDELNNLIRNKNTTNYIKGQRLGWFGHVHHMTNYRMVKKIVWVETDSYKTDRTNN